MPGPVVITYGALLTFEPKQALWALCTCVCVFVCECVWGLMDSYTQVEVVVMTA